MTGGEVVLHFGMVSRNGQHLEHNTSGLQVSHWLSMEIGAVCVCVCVCVCGEKRHKKPSSPNPGNNQPLL